tara:strand:+ start:2510 stop:2680 length:171 start_codon:yes stop_codon:yes gene_type:complete
MGAKKKKGGKIYYGSDKLFKQAFPGGVKDAIKLVDPNPPHTLVKKKKSGPNNVNTS